MKRLMSLLVALVVAGVMMSTVSPAAAYTIVHAFTFDKTLDPFQVISDSGDSSDTNQQQATINYACYDIVTGGLTGVDNGCARVENRVDSLQGVHYVALLAQLKGQGWMVTLDFAARDLDNCGQCGVIVYVGNAKPAGLGSFQAIGPVLGHEWTQYHYETWFGGSNPVVAVGVMNLTRSAADGPPRPEVQHAGIDNLRVKLLDD
jgi:hypothetical protein